MGEADIPFQVPTNELTSAFNERAVLTINRDNNEVSRTLSVIRLGRFEVRSGRLIVGDFGMSFDMCEPFVRRAPPGTHDVLVSIWGLRRWNRWMSASDGMGDSPRVAYMGLRFSDERPVRYEFASTAEHPPHWTPTDVLEGFGVDVGGVGILNAEDLPAIHVRMGNGDHSALCEQAYSQHRECARLAGFVRLPGDGRVVLPLAESGFGDGSYFSYWGLSESNDPVVLIVDFDLGNKWGQY